jgi:hypothetical protein
VIIAVTIIIANESYTELEVGDFNNAENFENYSLVDHILIDDVHAYEYYIEHGYDYDDYDQEYNQYLNLFFFSAFFFPLFSILIFIYEMISDNQMGIYETITRGSSNLITNIWLLFGFGSLLSMISFVFSRYDGDGYFNGMIGLISFSFWLLVMLLLRGLVWSPKKLKRKGVKENEAMLRNSETAIDLANKYVSMRVPEIKESIDELTPQNLDEKVREVLEIDIKKFQGLLQLNDINIDSTQALTDFTFEVTSPFRKDLKEALRIHLSNVLLGEKEEVADIGSMIDNLLDQYKKMEDTGEGKI